MALLQFGWRSGMVPGFNVVVRRYDETDTATSTAAMGIFPQSAEEDEPGAESRGAAGTVAGAADGSATGTCAKRCPRYCVDRSARRPYPGYRGGTAAAPRHP